ncbi:MAG: hypothetical protein ACPGVC_07180 [Salibacteraceae bacterium]
MNKILLITFCLIGSIGFSQTFNAGLRFQKTQNMYWENGVAFQYTFKNMNPDKWIFGFDYVTSRLGSAINSNALKQDNFILSASYNFGNKELPVKFFLRANTGLFVVDYEYDIFKDIPNKALLLGIEPSVCYIFKEAPIKMNLGLNINFATTKEGYNPGTLQTFMYHLDFFYTVFKK